MFQLQSVREQISGLERATGAGAMRRPDYRQPLRARMLVDAKADALRAAGAPPHVIGVLSGKRIRDWPEQAKAKLRG